MKGLLILGDCFEDTEALASTDVLLRAGEDIFRASVMDRLAVRTQCGAQIVCDGYLKDLKYEDFDYLILPGGKASFTVLDRNPDVERWIDEFFVERKLIASICAAPHLLGRKGYFKEREFTCFPGFEKYCVGGIYRRDVPVIRDDRFVTAKSMYYSIEFGLSILAFLYGEEKTEKIRLRLMGEES